MLIHLIPAVLAADVLVYGPADHTESKILEADGHTVTVWDEKTWTTASTEDFAAFDAIVIGDEGCNGPLDTTLDPLYASRKVWSPAIIGNIIATGTDASCHKFGAEGAISFLKTSVAWAASGNGTGAYFSSEWGLRDYDYLDQFGEFETFNDHGEIIVIVDTEHPALDGLTGEDLSTWGDTHHSNFDAYPADFTLLAIDGDGDPVMVVRESCDADDDGHAVDNEFCNGDDCDDNDATAYPGGEEIWYDGVDGDCDGASDYDADGDGYDVDSHGGNDCDDTDPAINPGADDTPDDGIDQDCDGDDDATWDGGTGDGGATDGGASDGGTGDGGTSDGGAGDGGEDGGGKDGDCGCTTASPVGGLLAMAAWLPLWMRRRTSLRVGSNRPAPPAARPPRGR